MLTVFFDFPPGMAESDPLWGIVSEFERAGLRVVETHFIATYLVSFLGSPKRMFPSERTIQARNFTHPQTVNRGILFDIATKCVLLSDDEGGPVCYVTVVQYFSEFVLRDPAGFR